MKRMTFILVGLIVSATAAGQGEISIREAPAWDDGFDPQVNEYDVVKGDTLWDISQRVVGDPYKWPKVWSLNPEITNPHWIFPGDRIRFFQPTQDLPSQADLIGGTMGMPDYLTDVDPDNEDIEEIAGADADTLATRSTGPAIEIIGGKRRRGMSTGLLYRYLERFVTPQELQEAGVLTNASPDAILLSTGDQVYLRFPDSKRPERGAKVLAYRTKTEVFHPESGSHSGYLTQITGVLEVESAKANTVTKARVVQSFCEIERGNHIAIADEDILIRLVRVPTAKDIKGVVMAVRHGFEGMAGDFELVYIDKGKSHGLERGNQLRVMTKGDFFTGERNEGLVRSVGLLQVLDARDSISTCLVLRALREVEPGAVVQTVVETSAKPGAKPEAKPEEAAPATEPG